MMKCHSVVVLLLVAGLAACSKGPTLHTNPTGQPNSSAPGLPSTDLKALSTNGSALPWYVAIKVSATSPNVPKDKQSAVLRTTRARKTWDQVKQFLGVGKEVQRYSFVVNSSVDQLALPPLTAIQVTNDKSAGEVVKLEVLSGISSPWVAIERSSKITLKFVHAGSATTNFDIFDRMASTVVGIASVSGLAVPATEIGQGALKIATDSLRTGYENAYNFKIDASETREFRPLDGDPGGMIFTMRDVDGLEIATIKVEFIFEQTLRGPLATPDINSYPDLSDALLESPAFKYLDGTNSPKLITAQIAADKSLSEGIRNPKDATSFAATCRSLTEYLVNDGLNNTDVTFFAARYLRDNSPIRERPDLNSTVWTNCLQGRRDIAEKIGVASDVSPSTEQLDQISIQSLGDLIIARGKSQNARVKSSSLLHGALSWEGGALTRDEALDKLAEIPDVTGYHCTSVSNPMIYDDGVQYGVSMFLRRSERTDPKSGDVIKESKPDLVLFLSSAKNAQQGSQARFIELRSPTDDEFKLCIAQEKGRGGLPPL